jgi:predicted MFS family arabinose efflux permease
VINGIISTWMQLIMVDSALPETEAKASDVSSLMALFLAAGCGVIAAGSYIGPPLASSIAAETGIRAALSGAIVSVGQIGYVLGLIFIAPLGDLLENRSLLCSVLIVSVASLGAISVVTDPASLFLGYFFLGMAGIAMQLMVTQVAFLGKRQNRGRLVGLVSSGLLAGMMLAWPFASFIQSHLGWRFVYRIDGCMVALLAALLLLALPSRRPKTGGGYLALLRSMVKLMNGSPDLPMRAAIQAFLFASFTLFWTAAPIELATRHGLNTSEIALFGLFGGAGALVAPIAGRLADRGHGEMLRFSGMCAISIGFAISLLSNAIWALAIAAIAVNAGVQANHIVSQRAILLQNPEQTSRANSLYVAIFFLGGAVGSLSAPALTYRGWSSLALIGASLGLVGLTLFRAARLASGPYEGTSLDR